MKQTLGASQQPPWLAHSPRLLLLPHLPGSLLRITLSSSDCANWVGPGSPHHPTSQHQLPLPLLHCWAAQGRSQGQSPLRPPQLWAQYYSQQPKQQPFHFSTLKKPQFSPFYRLLHPPSSHCSKRLILPCPGWGSNFFSTGELTSTHPNNSCVSSSQPVGWGSGWTCHSEPPWRRGSYSRPSVWSSWPRAFSWAFHVRVHGVSLLRGLQRANPPRHQIHPKQGFIL